MNDSEQKVISAMRRYGGSFVAALAEAYIVADGNNRRLIRETWADYWTQYVEMSERLNDNGFDPYSRG